MTEVVVKQPQELVEGGFTISTSYIIAIKRDERGLFYTIRDQDKGLSYSSPARFADIKKCLDVAAQKLISHLMDGWE